MRKEHPDRSANGPKALGSRRLAERAMLATGLVVLPFSAAIVSARKL